MRKVSLWGFLIFNCYWPTYHVYNLYLFFFKYSRQFLAELFFTLDEYLPRNLLHLIIIVLNWTNRRVIKKVEELFFLCKALCYQTNLCCCNGCASESSLANSTLKNWNATYLFCEFPNFPKGSPARPPSPMKMYRYPSRPKRSCPPLWLEAGSTTSRMVLTHETKQAAKYRLHLHFQCT